MADPSARATAPANTVVMGLGYVGLPTAIALALAGENVLGVDCDATLVAQINSGHLPHLEPGLQPLLAQVIESGHFRAATSPVAAAHYVIAVPTPLTPDHQPDLQHVMAATAALAPYVRADSLILLESTCPVGTTEALRDQLAILRPDLNFPHAGGEQTASAIAYCPERVLPGRILEELIGNDRCVGGITPACAQRAAQFYAKFVHGHCTRTNARTAELVKLAENSFRDVNIAFANELSLAADRLGINIWDAIQCANHHPRVNILQPGPGVGGHCVAVDPWFLIHGSGGDMPLLRTARAVNHAKTQHVTARIAATLAADPGLRVALLGLSFKADSDDVRESPALAIAHQLAAQFGARVYLVDPHVKCLPPALLATQAQCVALEAALAQCDMLALLVDHAAFRALRADQRAGKIIYDTRGIWPQDSASA